MVSSGIKIWYIINTEKSKGYFLHFSRILRAEKQCVITDSQESCEYS